MQWALRFIGRANFKAWVQQAWHYGCRNNSGSQCNCICLDCWLTIIPSLFKRGTECGKLQPRPPRCMELSRSPNIKIQRAGAQMPIFILSFYPPLILALGGLKAWRQARSTCVPCKYSHPLPMQSRYTGQHKPSTNWHTARKSLCIAMVFWDGGPKNEPFIRNVKPWLAVYVDPAMNYLYL